MEERNEADENVPKKLSRKPQNSGHDGMSCAHAMCVRTNSRSAEKKSSQILEKEDDLAMRTMRRTTTKVRQRRQTTIMTMMKWRSRESLQKARLLSKRRARGFVNAPLTTVLRFIHSFAASLDSSPAATLPPSRHVGPMEVASYTHTHTHTPFCDVYAQDTTTCVSPKGYLARIYRELSVYL